MADSQAWAEVRRLGFELAEPGRIGFGTGFLPFDIPGDFLVK
jgi:hypothetical protein